jgi:hypothetical protein
MSVAKVVEINAASPKGFEDAMNIGIVNPRACRALGDVCQIVKYEVQYTSAHVH